MCGPANALPAFTEYPVERESSSPYVRDFPGSGPAFVVAQITYQLTDEVAANTAHLLEFRRLDVPLLLIWRKHNPYLHMSIAKYMRSNARHGVLHVLYAGHSPQIGAAADVARILLAVH